MSYPIISSGISLICLLGSLATPWFYIEQTQILPKSMNQSLTVLQPFQSTRQQLNDMWDDFDWDDIGPPSQTDPISFLPLDILIGTILALVTLAIFAGTAAAALKKPLLRYIQWFLTMMAALQFFSFFIIVLQAQAMVDTQEPDTINSMIWMQGTIVFLISALCTVATILQLEKMSAPVHTHSNLLNEA